MHCVSSCFSYQPLLVGSLEAALPQAFPTSLQESYVKYHIQLLPETHIITIQYSHSADLMSIPMAHLSAWTSASNLTQVATDSSNSTADFMSSLPDYLGFAGPYFAILGREIRLYVARVQSTWIRLALGSGSTNRVFAVCLGYVVVCLVFCLYLNILTVGNARTAGIAVRNAVRQQLLVLKVYIPSILCFLHLLTLCFAPPRLLHSSS